MMDPKTHNKYAHTYKVIIQNKIVLTDFTMNKLTIAIHSEILYKNVVLYLQR